MARLSKKQSRHVSFLLHKMALLYGHDERQELLSKLLDALNIDAEQRAESADDAQHSVRRDARRQRPAKPADGTPDIRSMGRDELQQLWGAPAPELETPSVEEAPMYDVTAKQRRRLAAFDDLSDSDQIDQLASLWGEDGQP